MQMQMSSIAHGVVLLRYSSNPDDVGAISHWDSAIHELYARMPFKPLFNMLKLEVWDAEHELFPYDLKINAGVFYTGLRRIALKVKGPRLITPSFARDVLPHEFGHYYRWVCIGRNDEVAQKLKLVWESLRPHQGHNESEDFAEVYRATHGINSVRGTYSDGSKAAIRPELFSLINCMYWLSGNLAGLKVHDIIPIATGVKYQAFIAGRWRWRFVSNAWQSQEFDGQKWIKI